MAVFVFALRCGVLVLGCLLLAGGACAQDVDRDEDGLDDRLEQALLERFLPEFHVSKNDCADVPVSFVPGQEHPRVAAADGTIYGQATPGKLSGSGVQRIELRYFHL
jgi:hypothetical protein